jgi:hypothetical protein
MPAAPPSEVSDHLTLVIAAAERAAGAIRADAEEQARRQLNEARRRTELLAAERLRMIAQLTDGLIEQAETVREHSARMVATLQRATDEISGGLGLPSGEAPDPAGLERERTAPARASQSEALLIATELAVAGESRETIAARIRAQLGVDPEPVLKRILG